MSLEPNWKVNFCMCHIPLAGHPGQKKTNFFSLLYSWFHPEALPEQDGGLKAENIFVFFRHFDNNCSAAGGWRENWCFRSMPARMCRKNTLVQ